MDASTLKGHGFEFFERASIIFKFVSLNYWDKSWPMLVNMGWEKSCLWKFTAISNFKNVLWFFLRGGGLKVVISICRLVKNHPSITCVIPYVNLLKLMGSRSVYYTTITWTTHVLSGVWLGVDLGMDTIQRRVQKRADYVFIYANCFEFNNQQDCMDVHHH